MNVDPPSFVKSLPVGVRPTGEVGVYTVASRTRVAMEHRVDCHLLQCGCERATKGMTRKAALLNGGCPPFEAMCWHLRHALAYHAMAVLSMWQNGERQLKQK